MGFWNRVASTPSTPFDPNKMLLVDGKPIGKTKELQSCMFKRCIDIHPFVTEILSREPVENYRHVVDLGCGSGANALSFYRSGASVTAIDSSHEAIDSLKDQFRLHLENKRPIESRVDELNPICEDITQIDSYGKNADLVIAIDTLPYLPPKSLQATMKKIHQALKKNGLFIGSLFVNGEEETQNFMKNLGAHFYSTRNGEQFIVNFLKLSGFIPIRIEPQESGFQFQALKAED